MKAGTLVLENDATQVARVGVWDFACGLGVEAGGSGRDLTTQVDVARVWDSGVPLELETAAYETAQSGARLYCVTGQMAQTILDEYGAAAYSPDDVFSDLPEKEAAYVLVLP